tara:strand:- start:1249 stop:1833 length:585 start_codon:yes stop_codon:yes gene_type:complete
MAKRGLEGNFQAQPRVFAHDMIPIALGNINPDGGLKMTSGAHGGGGSYNPDQIITLTTPGGATQAAKVKVLTVTSAGAIDTFEVTFSGTANKPFGEGYAVGAAPEDAGSGNAAFEVVNIDIPYTKDRGACLYSGIAIDNGLDLILESDIQYQNGYTARLKGITAGSFLPVLAKRVVAVNLSSGSYGAGDLVALY